MNNILIIDHCIKEKHCDFFFSVTVARDSNYNNFFSELKRNIPPLCICNFHTDDHGENRRMILALKGQSEWSLY